MFQDAISSEKETVTSLNSCYITTSQIIKRSLKKNYMYTMERKRLRGRNRKWMEGESKHEKEEIRRNFIYHIPNTKIL